LLTLGQASLQVAAATDQKSSRRSGPADIGPHLERTHPCSAVLTGGDAVAAKMEEVGDLFVSREKTLCMLR
jgi:hypothetical protein